jgi:hypothetical protein
VTPRRLWKRFTAPRTTVALLVLLAGMLLLNVALPQEAVLGHEEFARMLTGHPRARFFLVTLGLGRLATSPVFVAVLVLFFLNLAAVLAARVGPTVRRSRMRERSERGLEAWARVEESFAEPVPESWRPGRAVEILRGHGYRVRRAGERTFWGVKHRTAPLGFLLFHLSFFLLCAGGVAIYLTRFVGTAVVVEGQEFAGEYQRVLRHAPWTGPPELAFGLAEVDPRFVDGEPVHLGATLSFRTPGVPVERRARVNHPARWGASEILVQGAGLAPVLWLQDGRGFTVDRVAASARTRIDPMAGAGGAEPTEVPLAGGRLTAVVEPLAPGEPFPERAALGETVLGLRVLRGPAGDGAPDVLFEGALRPGQGAPLTAPGGALEGRLVLEEIRYWAGLQVVRERGGGLLIAGFTLGVLGLIWRLLLHRREVALTWDDETVRLVGRSEHFSGRFGRELATLFADLGGGGGDSVRETRAKKGGKG